MKVLDSGPLLSLVGEAARCAPDERIIATPVVCRTCGADTFEVVGNECFCEVCCVPLGIEDGDLYSSELPFVLAPSAALPDTDRP